jgi:hypothetical protein
MSTKSAAMPNNRSRVDRLRPVGRPAAEPEEEIDTLSLIELRYGDIVEILTEMGFRGSTSERAFNDYLKSLRKLDLPVSRRNARRRGHMIIYSYENVMDLVLAMILIVVTGVYLDLRLDHASGRLISFGPPRALSPEQAIVQFAQADVAARAFVPIRLSYFAEKVVDLALERVKHRAAS